MIRIYSSLLALFLLAGCGIGDIPPARIPDVCRAMLGPIRYNSHDKNSRYYAAYLLSMSLAQRNRVYDALHCPKV